MAHFVISSFPLALIRLFVILLGVFSLFRLFAWRYFVLAPCHNAKRKDEITKWHTQATIVNPYLCCKILIPKKLSAIFGYHNLVAYKRKSCISEHVYHSTPINVNDNYPVIHMSYSMQMLCVYLFSEMYSRKKIRRLSLNHKALL